MVVFFFFTYVFVLLRLIVCTPHVHADVLCVGRCAVPATLLSHVLGLPADWLSRLSGSVQRYVSVPQQPAPGGSAATFIAH